jgi:predicted phosphate transport protein (TIGR00153 family)
MNLLPREDKFFGYFRQQVKFLNAAADLLVEGARSGNAHLASTAHQIQELEQQADTVIHEIYARLNATFITPLDPEDIHTLASHLDDVIDGIEECAHWLSAYHIDPLPSTIVELCKLVQSCGVAIGRAIDAMEKKQPFIDHCIEINRLESAADQLTRPAIKELFEKEKDPVRLIQLKEIYTILEETADCCEDVADALQNIQVKNS